MKKKYMIVIVLIILLILTPFTFNKIETNYIKDGYLYISKIINIPIKYIEKEIIIIKDKNELYDKYIKLKKEDKNTIEDIDSLKKEISDLKSILELNSVISDYKKINATVINRNYDYWYNSVNIDKGKKHGIKKGDAVINSLGLIGRVTSVSKNTSTVTLLSTNEIKNKISVKINSNNFYSYGLIYGYDEDNNVYKIEGVSNSESIKEGDIVTTTGLTDYFPSGIIIGEVKRVTKDEYDLNSIIEVTPSVDFNNINYVTILDRSIK